MKEHKINQLMKWFYDFLLLLIGVILGSAYTDGALILMCIIFGIIVVSDMIIDLKKEGVDGRS